MIVYFDTDFLGNKNDFIALDLFLQDVLARKVSLIGALNHKLRILTVCRGKVSVKKTG